MLVRTGGRDERGSALVSVLVMMLVLTLFSLTLASIVTNTGARLISGRSMAQARAAADAGVAAALAAFKKGEACLGTITSVTALVYTATCVAGLTTVTFTSIGIADGGLQVRVQAVYGFTTAQSYAADVGQFTAFSETTTYPPNKVTSTTSDPAMMIVAQGDLRCTSAMTANLVIEEDFIADPGCSVSGWVKARRDVTLNSNSSVSGSLTAGRNVILNSVTAVGGSLTSGGYAKLSSYSYVGADLTTGGYSDLASSTLVVGNLTSIGYSDVEGTVNGNLASASYVFTGDNSSIGGSVTAGGTDRTWIHGTVAKDVMAAGPVTTDYGSVVTGDVIAAGGSTSEIRGKLGGDLAAGGAVLIDSAGSVAGNITAAGTASTSINGTIAGTLQAGGAVTINGTAGGDVTAAGTGLTSVYGTLTGNLKAAGAAYVHNNRTVFGDVSAAANSPTTINGTITGSLKAGGAVTVNGTVSGALTAAGTGLTSVNGTVVGSLKVAGTVMVNYNRPVRADVTTSGTGKDTIYGQISGSLNAGGDVDIPGGSIGGNLTLPSGNALTPSNAPSRVAGTVTRKAAPAAPGPPAAPNAPAGPPIPPLVKVTIPANPSIPTWTDYGYSSADWPGYTIQVLGKTSSWCTARNWATYLASFTVPTVVDATSCSAGLNTHPTSSTVVTINANVVVLSSRIDLQYFTFKAATGKSPSLWFIVPSAGGGVKPYAGIASGTGKIDLNSSNLGVPTLLYTPDTINFTASTFTGSMYAERIAFASGPPGDIKAAPLDFPVALFDPVESTTTSPGIFSVTRISQREVP